MLKTFIILLFGYITGIAAISNNGDSYKLVYPEFIPVNSSYDVSILTTNPYSDADQLILYIIPPDGISPNSIKLNSVSGILNLDFTPAVLSKFNLSAYKTTIDLSDTTLSIGTYFQILLNFNSSDRLKSELKLYGIYMNADSVVGYLENDDENGFTKTEGQLSKTSLKYYKPEKSAGKSLLIGKNSFFRIPLNSFSSNNLLTEFWIKLNESGTQIIKVNNKSNAQTIFNISTNAFQTLSVTSGIAVQKFLNPYFIGKKSWYHISILFSYNTNEALFYCNGKLISKNNLPGLSAPENLELNFGDINQQKSFQIDLLRFIDLQNSIIASFKNKSYLNFLSDSSTVLAQLNFDESENLVSQKNRLNIYSSGTQLIKSDAPIFARAPELNINLLSSSYELEWNGGDFEQADKYVLQKSTNNSKYRGVFTIDADNTETKNYSFLDAKDNNSDIVFYRVKQVNIDGTVVYSSSVKVGQGKMQPFILEQNYPNPFNPKTSINIDLVHDSEVQITIYNLEGKEINKLFKGHLGKGTHSFSFDATDLPSGLYLYKVSTPDYTETKKMILTK